MVLIEESDSLAIRTQSLILRQEGRYVSFCHYSVVLLVKSQRFLVSFLARNTYNYPGRYFVKVKALRSVTLDTTAVS